MKLNFITSFYKQLFIILANVKRDEINDKGAFNKAISPIFYISIQIFLFIISITNFLFKTLQIKIFSFNYKVVYPIFSIAMYFACYLYFYRSKRHFQNEVFYFLKISLTRKAILLSIFALMVIIDFVIIFVANENFELLKSVPGVPGDTIPD